MTPSSAVLPNIVFFQIIEFLLTVITSYFLIEVMFKEYRRVQNASLSLAFLEDKNCSLTHVIYKRNYDMHSLQLLGTKQPAYY